MKAGVVRRGDSTCSHIRPFTCAHQFGVLMKPRQTLPSIAYFSMEIALDPSIPTHSGGLGGLAGDTLRSAAHLAVPIVAVTLAHTTGYFPQHLDANGNQTEEPQFRNPEHPPEEMPGWLSV